MACVTQHMEIGERSEATGAFAATGLDKRGREKEYEFGGVGKELFQGAVSPLREIGPWPRTRPGRELTLEELGTGVDRPRIHNGFCIAIHTYHVMPYTMPPTRERREICESAA